MSTPLEVFCCYAREDQEMLAHLRRHLIPLQRQGQITIWSDTDLSAGAEWEKVLHQHLESADIILLLISPYFMASDYCYSTEMQIAITRHLANEARVIPVLLRPVDWSNTPFSALQVLPSDARPVTSWPDRDAAFEDVAKGIRKVVEELLATNLVVPDMPALSDMPALPASNSWQPPMVSLLETQRPSSGKGEEQRNAPHTLVSHLLSPLIAPTLKAGFVGKVQDFRSRTESRMKTIAPEEKNKRADAIYRNNAWWVPETFHIWNFKVVLYDTKDDIKYSVPIVMRGTTFYGKVVEGDMVRVPYSWRSGKVIEAKGIYNQTTFGTVTFEKGPWVSWMSVAIWCGVSMVLGAACYPTYILLSVFCFLLAISIIIWGIIANIRMMILLKPIDV